MDDQPMSPGMPMMDCETVMRLLWDLLDGTLGPVDEMAVREHVHRCRHCHPHATFGEIVLNAVAAQRQPITEALPLRNRVLDALRAEGFEAPSER